MQADEPSTEAVAVERALARFAQEPGPLLPVLHHIQDALGFVPPACFERVAGALGLSRAEVHGVVSFYHDFRTEPPGRHVVRVCRAEACQAVGGRPLEAHLAQRLGLRGKGTTPDRSITVEPVYCLGNCALSPSVQIDGELHARVTPEALDQLLDALERS